MSSANYLRAWGAVSRAHRLTVSPHNPQPGTTRYVVKCSCGWSVRNVHTKQYAYTVHDRHMIKMFNLADKEDGNG